MPVEQFKAENLLLQTGSQVSFSEFAEVDGVTSANIELVARTTSSVNTRFGALVHELSGMFSKDRIPLDWCHDKDEIIGYLDSFRTTKTEIICSGKVVSAKDGDKASEVMKLSKAGVPYEASIFFGGEGMVAERVLSEKDVTVNLCRLLRRC